MEDAVIKKVVENAKFEVPSGMVESEIDMRIKSFENNLYYQGLTLEKYFLLVYHSSCAMIHFFVHREIAFNKTSPFYFA